MQHNEQNEQEKKVTVYLLGINSRMPLEPEHYIQRSLQEPDGQLVFDTPTGVFRHARGDYAAYRGIVELEVPVSKINEVNGKKRIPGSINKEWVTGVLILSNQDLLKDKPVIEIGTEKRKVKYVATIFEGSDKPWPYHKIIRAEQSTSGMEKGQLSEVDDGFHEIKPNTDEVYGLIQSIVGETDFWKKQARGASLPRGIGVMQDILSHNDSLANKLTAIKALASKKETKGKPLSLFQLQSLTRGGVTKAFYSAVAALDIDALKKIEMKIKEYNSLKLKSKSSSNRFGSRGSTSGS